MYSKRASSAFVRLTYLPHVTLAVFLGLSKLGIGAGQFFHTNGNHRRARHAAAAGRADDRHCAGPALPMQPSGPMTDTQHAGSRHARMRTCRCG
jgi:hypothetical protein